MEIKLLKNFMKKSRYLVLAFGILIFTGFYSCSETFAASRNTSSPKKEIPNEKDFGPYMSKMQRTIKNNWTPPQSTVTKSTTLQYRINKDGTVPNITVLKSSRSKKMDASAVKALTLSVPFDPLPSSFKDDYIDVQFTFDYNADKGNINNLK